METKAAAEKARDYTKFYTPPLVAEFMAELLDPKPFEFVLEPSAGDGCLVRAVKEICPKATIAAYEIASQHKRLIESGATIVTIKDFLTVELAGLPFDSCIANPPFGNGTDLQAHFDKICELVKPGGNVVMIVPADFIPGLPHTKHPIDNWSKNSDGSTTEIAVITFSNPGPQKKERCELELYIEEYYGMDPAKTHEKMPINTDFGHLVNLLAMFRDKLINKPEVNDFIEGVKREAKHQVERWGIENEEQSPPHHFSLVLSKLAGKFAVDIFDRDVERFKHHCIAIAAEMFNIHRQIDKPGTEINKWFKSK